ncbi:MAG: tetratricopeptide repeat protein [Gammaproteobacteria bacterium]|nr:tetratricopeptide repeat protein [Gammaproteobacteria bacterium]MBT8134820.1 tetratricopeptide repeat protein [Gammaproteobacteria bacterium]NNJ50963.1 tetratricopeptide repeat protein [Gammaproteobacteria bacterium]
MSTSTDSSVEVEKAVADEAVTKNTSATPGPESGSRAASTQADEDSEIVIQKNNISMDGDMLYNLLAAEFAGNSGDVEASLDFYREAAKSVDDSRIAARTAYIALYGENYEETLKALDRWRELEPEAIDLSRMYAVTYLKLEQPEKAVPYIEDLLSDYHDSPADEAMAVKQLLSKEASNEVAYVVLQKLNEKNSENKHLLVLQSRYAAQLEHYDQALALLDQVLVMDPSLHEVLLIKARILSAQGKNDEATLLIKQVVDELPDNNVLRLQYARMLVEQQKMLEATEQYAILQKNLPDDGEISLSLALLYIETKQLDRAVEVLEHLVEIDKKVPIANYYLGRIAQNQGDEKQAISYYLGVKTGEYSYDAQLRIGILLAVLGKPDDGLAKLEALAEEQTSWALRVKSYLAQGEILRVEKRFEEGVEMYSRALQQKRDDTTLLYARGLMAEKVDRLDMTEADLRKVISKEPDNADALNALGYTLADRTSRYKEAQEYIKRAAELVPDDPAILDSLGWVSYRLGEMDEALRWLAKAFEKLEDAEIAAHYGEVLWKTNQKDKAREVWNKGKKQNAENPVLIETLKRINP